MRLIMPAALCNAQGVKGYPQMNLYRDGDFVDTYYGSRSFDLLMTHLAAATPRVPSGLHPNPDGEIAILNPQNFTATLAHGPTFVSFYPQYCNDCPLAVWRELAMATQHSVTIAEVYCGGDDDLGFCGVHSIPVEAGHEPSLVYYPSKGAPVKYTGPRKLAQLRAFTEVGGIYPPPVMKFTHQTYRTVMAAPVLVIATVGTDTEESVVARLREIALEWSLPGLPGRRTVQFAWENSKSDDRLVRDPLAEDVDVFVHIVDHEVSFHSSPLPTFF
jgi:hypothetical protein